MISYDKMITLEPRFAPTVELEMHLLILLMLASLPTLVTLLCTPQMVVRNCVAAGGAWVNGTLQSTATAHAVLHNACVVFAAAAFSLGLLLHAWARRPSALALTCVLFFNKVALVTAVIKLFTKNTVSGGELIGGQLHQATIDDSVVLCALYAITVISVVHVVSWVYCDWTLLIEGCKLAPVAVAAVTVTALYVIALTLGNAVVSVNGLQMFRNASVASCMLTESVWVEAKLNLQ